MKIYWPWRKPQTQPEPKNENLVADTGTISVLTEIQALAKEEKDQWELSQSLEKQGKAASARWYKARTRKEELITALNLGFIRPEEKKP